MFFESNFLTYKGRCRQWKGLRFFLVDGKELCCWSLPVPEEVIFLLFNVIHLVIISRKDLPKKGFLWLSFSSSFNSLNRPLCAQLLSGVWLFAAPWTVVCQAPLSMEFFRQEYQNGLPFPSAVDLPDPGIKTGSPALAGGFFTTEPPGKSSSVFTISKGHIPSLMRKKKLPFISLSNFI